MTQLVQLQHTLPLLNEAGYEVFAISNDTVERLAEFSEQHSISFNLLADVDSTVIRAFGIMNTLIRPDEGKHMRWYGIPYPGTYITDANGLIVDKDFHQHHARRLSGPALARRVLGTELAPAPAGPAVVQEGEDLVISARLVEPTLRLEVLGLLACRIKIAGGRHVYASGAPAAFTPVTLQCEGNGVRFGTPVWPEPSMLNMAELSMAVPVHDGEFEVSIPVTATSALIRLGHGLDAATAELSITCTYQSCDEFSCRLPTTLQTTLVVPLETLVEPPGIKTYARRVAQAQVDAECNEVKGQEK